MKSLIIVFAVLSCSCIAFAKNFVEDIPNETSIPNMLLERKDFDFQYAPQYLWKALERNALYIGIDTAFLADVRAMNIGKVVDLPKLKSLPGVSLYRLDECQAIIPAIFIANNLPVMFERAKDATDTDHSYALFYRYVLKNEEVINKKTEFVYLAHYMHNYINVIKQNATTRMDKNQNPLSSDLFDYDEKKQYSSLTKHNYQKDVTIDDNKNVKYEVESYMLPHLWFDNIYVLVPSSMSQKNIEQLIEAGLGSRDFSYKVPKILKLM